MKTIQREMYECSFCKRAYEDVEYAESCEQNCREKQEEKKIQEEIYKERNSIRERATSVDHLAELLESFAKRCGKPVKVKFERMNINMTLSNSHSCPIGGVTNWRRASDKPRGYPGISGRIEVSKLNEKTRWLSIEAFGNNPMNSDLKLIPGINLGSGGGGSYEVFLFFTDFPKINRKFKKLDSLISDQMEFHGIENEHEEKLYHLIETAHKNDPEVIFFQNTIQLLKDEIKSIEEDMVKRCEVLSAQVKNKNPELVPKEDKFQSKIEKLIDNIGADSWW